VPPDAPTGTAILSDNLGNVRVSENIGSSTNSRPFLIRYECLHQRIDDRQITVHHVRDPDNPSDFLRLDPVRRHTVRPAPSVVSRLTVL
jgi:hypothetical protein